MSRFEAVLKTMSPAQQAKTESGISQLKIDLGALFKGMDFSFLATALLRAAIGLVESTILPKLTAMNPQLAAVLAMVLDTLQEALQKPSTANAPPYGRGISTCCDSCTDCEKCVCCKDCKECEDCICCEGCSNCVDCVDCHNQKGLTGKVGVGRVEAA